MAWVYMGYASPRICIRAGYLTDAQVVFWETLYRHSLIEYFMHNNIDLHNVAKFVVDCEPGLNDTPINVPRNISHPRILIPLGAGIVEQFSLTLTARQRQRQRERQNMDRCDGCD
jgi:hypothetical protein